MLLGCGLSAMLLQRLVNALKRFHLLFKALLQRLVLSPDLLHLSLVLLLESGGQGLDLFNELLLCGVDQLFLLCMHLLHLLEVCIGLISEPGHLLPRSNDLTRH